MDILVKAGNYAASNLDKFILSLWQHLLLVFVPLAIGLCIGLSFGFFSSRSRTASTILTNSFNSLRVIPSLAILFIAIPYFGLSFTSAAIALTLLAIPPILISTDVAFRNIDPAIKEAAKGMGMEPRQVLQQIEFPLALPLIISGIKTATVEIIASATLAAFIGAGGLGTFIVLGFALYDNAILLVGALPVAVLALAAEVGLGLIQRSLQRSQTV
ncbi:MAG: ABC transporter permease [Coleofasciculaceae cyanobacterium]